MSAGMTVLRHLPLLGQLTLACGLVVGAIVAPPADGAMLMVPLGRTALGPALAVAADHGALVVARGRIGSTAVIRGRRDRLAGPLLGRGVLLLAAPAGWCGA
jgi:hypothetical protein